MTKHRQITPALRFAIGAALLASAALMSGSANAQVLCSASGRGGARNDAIVTESGRDPTICIRVKFNTLAPPDTPDCWQAARDAGLRCVRPDGRVDIVDL
jgi:hypothetical protein